MGQIISIPRIFEHYQYHQLQPGNKDLSIMAFITMHYLGNDGDLSDDDRDSELPFLHYIHPFSLVAVSPPAAFSVLLHSNQPHSIKLGYYSNQHRPIDFSKGLLRPPRFVS